MKNKIYLLLLFLFSFGSSQAQLTFNLPNPTACAAGETVDLDVTVENFENLVAMQFTIVWSASVLNYVTIDNFHPDLGNTPLIITGNAANGSVNYTWAAELGDFIDGVDIPDGATLFTLHFTSTANLGTTNISFNDSQIPVVVEDNQSNVDNMITVNGGNITTGDTQDPTITCPSNYTANSSDGNPVQVNDDLSAMAVDNCNVATVTYSSTGVVVLMSPVSGMNDVTGQSFAVGATTVTYEVTDDTGLTNTCQFEVVITNNANTINLDIEDYMIGCNNSGNDISLQIFAENFNSVTGISFQIFYDNSLLMLLPTSDFHPNMDGFNNGNLFAPSPGTLNVFWQTNASNNATGINVPDGESLFTLNFTPVAALSNTSVDFNVNLVSLVGNVPADVNVMSGLITATMTASTADFNGTNTICNGEPTNLSVNISGGTAPYTVVYNDGNGDITIDDYENNDLISVNPSSSTTYTLISATDDNGCPITINTNTATVTVNQGPTAANILGGTDTCPGNVVDLMVTITDGTAPFTVVYTENIPGNSNSITLNNYQSNDPIQVAPTTSTIYTLVSVTDANDCVFNLSNVSTVVMANDENAPVFTTCPTNITQNVDADGCGAIITFSTPTAMDDCDASPSILLQTAINSGEEFPVGETTITFIAQDDAINNSDPCEFTVTIIDNEPPETVNCVPFIPPVSTDIGECSAVINFTEPTATDNCMIASSSASHNSGDAFPVGITNVTFTFTDNSGLMTTCNTTITVTENENPTITCPNDITAAASTMECTAIVNWTPPIPMDNCPGATATNASTFMPGDELPFGVTTITYNATDAADNIASCNFKITVFDETDPVFTTCPIAQTVAPDMDETTAVVDNLAPAVFDNCGIDTIYYVLMGATTGEGANDASGTAFELGETTVTYTTEDINGLTATCIFTITVMNNDELSLTCPDNQVETSALDSCGVTVFGLTPTATPISELDTVLYELTGATTGTGGNDASGIFYTVGITTVGYTATDNDGNELNCSFTVTISDIIDPTFTFCPSDTTNIPNNAGTCGAIFEYATPTATDDCSVIGNVSCSVASGEIFPVGTTTVICTAEDESENTTNCTFEVTVIDTETPTISCPMPQTVGVDMTGNSAVVDNISPVTADNCGIDTTFYVLTGATTDDAANDASGTSFNLGETTITYTTTDTSDSTATCSFTITVIDNADLTLNCPTNQIEISPADTCGIIVNDIAAEVMPLSELDTITYELTGATVGTGGNDASGIFYNIGITTVTYTATDNTGNMLNCSFTVTVNDNTIPVILDCPTDLNINVTANSCTNTATWASPNSTDNCPNLNMTSTHNSGAEFIVGNTVVTYLAADASGNQATCSFTITVTDNILPTLANCPTDMEISATTGDCSATATWTTPTILDNCPDAALSANHNIGDSFGLGNTQIIYTGTDASGNQATCSFTVTVTDEENPVITNCPNNITIPAMGANCEATATWAEPTATDNCPNVGLNGSPASGSIFQTGTTTVNYIATDGSGNTAQCSFTVTVQDNENPTVTFCPPSMTENAIQNECSANITWQAPVFADNCAITSVVSNHNSGDSFNVGGPISVVYTGSDASGNTATCQFTVEVIDNQLPIIFGLPDDITVGNAPGLCNAVVNYVAPQGFDNCGVTGFVTTHPSGSEFPIGTTTVDYIASDLAGNITMQSFTITVMDNEPPKPVCPENIEITVDGTNLSDPSGNVTNFTPIDCNNIILEIMEPMATDNCTMAAFTQTGGIDFTNGTPFPVGTNFIEYTATDASGNESTCGFNVTVNPIEFPTINLSSIFPCEGDDFIAQLGSFPNASFNWLNENGDLVTNGSAYPIPNITTTDGGVYTIEMVLPSCTLSQQFQLTVFEKPEILASANDILCTDGNQDLNLMATTQNGVAVDNYQWLFNGSVFSMEQNPTIENVTTANAGQYIVRAISNNGCFDTDTVTVNVSAVVQIPILTANQDTTCVGTTIDLTAQSYFGNAVEYVWTVDPAVGSGLVAVNNFTTTATPTAAGTYTYSFFAIVDGCQTDIAEVAINVGEPPVLSPDVVGDLVCVDGTTSMTLQSNFSNSAATYIWTFDNNLLSNDENVTVDNITTNESGNYKIVVTLPNGCQSEAALDLNITESIAEPAPILGEEVACVGESITLTGTDYGIDNTTYIWLLNGSPIPNSNSPTITFVATSLGSNIISYSTTKNGCNSGTVIKNITIEAAPTADLEIDGETTCLAGNTPITLLSNNADAAVAFWLNEANVQVASTADFVIENANATNAGIYYFVAESANGCQNIDTISVQLTDGLPSIEAQLDGQPCEDANLKLSSTAIPNATYTWTDPAGDNLSSAQNPLLALASPEFNGMYTVTATANGCSTTDSVEVEILEVPTAIDDDLPVITDTATEFNVLLNDGVDLNQAIIVTILQPTTQGTLTNLNDGTFSYTPKTGSLESDAFVYQICYETCPNTCDIAFVNLNVQFPADNCTATTVITPNGDGTNDRFIVFCLDVEDYPENELTVFGSWGDEVFNMKGYDNSWKGTYENEPLPDGTYYYIFKRDPNAEAEKGFVMIYR